MTFSFSFRAFLTVQTLTLYTRYPIVARALGLAAAVQPLGRVRRASKGILHTNINHGQFYPIFGFWLKYQPFLVYKRLNNEDITYLLLHSTILTYIATTRTL